MDSARFETAETAALTRGDDLGMDELQAQTIRLAILGTLGLTLGTVFLTVFGLKSLPLILLLLSAGLLALAWLTLMCARRHPRAAAWTFIGGLVLLLSVTVPQMPSLLLAPWFSIAVLLASAVLNARSGILVATVVTFVMVITTGWPLAGIAGAEAFSAILLSWASLFAYWLISRPTRAALGWAWSSYNQALDQTRTARERQAELAGLSKGLSEFNYQLEQLNLELERARRAEQEARRLKAEFAAAVSHELRTPLNLIIGYCEMIVLSPASAYGQRLPTSYQHDLEAIYRNAGHISALVDDILDLSQIDADRMALHLEMTSMPSVIDEAIGAVEMLFQDRDLVLRTELADNIPSIYADHTRVRQILINLLGNAARFTEEGGVTICASRQSDAVILSVVDTGPGIPAEELPYVFEEFYQVRTPRGRRAGTGLGLTISKRFAELHGGTMWVESAGPGQGSSFFLKLPLIEPREDSTPPTRERGDRFGRRVRGRANRRLLVLDDSHDLPKVFGRYLDGYQVLHATGASDAKRHVQAGPVHALLLGSAAAAAAWHEHPCLPSNARTLPVITCALRTTERFASELAASDYLVKPVTREQLRSAIRKLPHAVRLALVVDDDADMLMLLTRMVKSLCRGSQVLQATDGAQALDMIRAHRPDVVLLDLLMPGMNGYDVLGAVRADAELRSTPVLVISARGLGDESVVANEVGLTRAGGLTVGEVMRWVRGGLDALLESDPAGAAPQEEPIE